MSQAAESALRQGLLQVLKKHWGHDAFRPMQEEIISSFLNGHDTVGLMPTGGGKSITFQVPGIYADGLTLVITPLISLMKDQVDSLRKRHVKAVYIYGGMSSAEWRQSWDLLTNGRARFLYCSPERLRNERFRAELLHLNVARIVIDEAHCVSQWGYDFRPDYLNIASLRQLLPGRPMLALTATATPRVLQDICEKTGMSHPRVFRTGFSRSNISYIVRPTQDKTQEMLHILRSTEGSAIVYVRSRRRTRDLSELLRSQGITALPYHAGMDSQSKAANQNEWMEGKVRVMVATNAFGMGIDKPDVRLVIHHDMPSSLEEYYQEAGRAGRDRKNSFAVLLAGTRDKAILRRRVSEMFPPREDVKRVYELLCTFLNVSIGEGYEKLFEFELAKFCKIFGYKDDFVRHSLRLLSQSGLITFLEEITMKSRLLLTISREELYNVSGLSPDAEMILTKILRLYTGLFTDYAYIEEEVIAHELSISNRRVYEGLLELSRAGVLSYIPRRRMPYIHFPTAREETRYIKIPKTVYEERIENISQRTEAMIDYAFNGEKCRVERVLEYFGEEGSGACGSCDVCRRHRSPSAKPDPEKTEMFLENIIASQPDGLMAADLKLVKGAHKEAIADALRTLVLSQRIEVRGGRYFPGPKCKCKVVRERKNL